MYGVPCAIKMELLERETPPSLFPLCTSLAKQLLLRSTGMVGSEPVTFLLLSLFFPYKWVSTSSFHDVVPENWREGGNDMGFGWCDR